MSELEQRIHSLTMRIRNAGAKAARDGTIQGNQFPDIGAITDELKVVNDEVDEAIAALIEREVQKWLKAMDGAIHCDTGKFCSAHQTHDAHAYLHLLLDASRRAGIANPGEVKRP